MIDFVIPATGSSGHIGGGILLAAMLGPYAALITIASVLIIQCLFFADGGMLALGANIFNLGVMTCFIAYPFVFRAIINKGLTPVRIIVASVLSVIIGLQLGAFGVVLQTVLSGITALPFVPFLSVMQPIHLAIGLAEGFITAAVLCFVYKMRPEIIENTLRGQSVKKLVIPMLIIAALVAGGLSLLASDKPDGLEWSMEKVAGTSELESDGRIHEIIGEIQEFTAFMPDYAFKSEDASEVLGTASAGIIGGVLTLVLAAMAGFTISRFSRRKTS
jgi:cobalt/nickel transport system permease protein